MKLPELRALLWNNWIVRIRHYVTFGFEATIPLLLTAVMIYVLSSARNGQDIGKEGKKIGTYVNITRYPNPLFTYGDFDFDYPLKSGPVYVVPNTRATHRVTVEINRLLKSKGRSGDELQLKFLFFSSEEGLLSQEAIIDGNKVIAGALIFTSLPEKWTDDSPFRYTIRIQQNSFRSRDIATHKKFLSVGQTGQWSAYSKNAFLSLQVLVNEAYLRLKAVDTGRRPLPIASKLSIRTIPYPAYTEHHTETIWMLLTIAFIAGLIVSFPTIVKRLADEKSNGSREMLRMMGLSDWTFWLANFVSNFIFMFTVMSVMLAMFFVRWNSTTTFFENSSYPAVLLFIAVYCVNTILWAFLISILINKPIPSVIVAVIFWALSLTPAVTLDPRNAPFATDRRLMACLLPNSALHFALQVMGEKESAEVGLHFHNFSSPNVLYGNLTMTVITVMMLASCVLLSVLIWYLNNVWPWQSGVPKAFWFPLTLSYWFRRRDVSQTHVKAQESPYFEVVSTDKAVAIRLSDVSKSYGTFSRKVSVAHLSLEIYRSQLTCLLGHNGAGKTTTMNMITGMFAPSRGSISINGYDIATQTQAARASISLCPQHNPLYEELTAAEHMFFYGAMKGCSWSRLGQEVVNTAADVTLTEHLTKHPSQLSGGMKRKLCLAIALIGGSEIVILDEPTSGLDTEVRRGIWDVLREARKSRTILMSTHDMEEADALADRIVIMTAGNVSCAGSTMFLKNLYGAGHSLRIAKLSSFDQKSTFDLIHKFFPKVKITSNVGTEIVFGLNDGDKGKDKSALSQFFREFEPQKTPLGIESFGLSVTTMEDVFLKVGDMAEAEKKENPDKNSIFIGDNGFVTKKETGMRLTMRRVTGLFLKRVNFAKRDWKILVFMLVIPAIILSIFLLVASGMKDPNYRFVSLVMNMDTVYGRSIGIFHKSESTSQFSDAFEKVSDDQKITLIADTKDKKGSSIDSSDRLADAFIEKMETESTETFLITYLIGMDAEVHGKSRNYTLWASIAAIHSPAIVLDLLYKTLDYELTGRPSPMQLTNHPLGVEQSDSYEMVSSVMKIAITMTLMIPIAMAFLGSSYVLFPIHEKASNAKLIQLMTGLNPLLLHFVNFLFDFCVHIIASLIAIEVIVILDRYRILNHNAIALVTVFLILLLFGASSIVMAYVAAFFLKKPGSGLALLIGFNLIFGFVFGFVAMVWQFIVREEMNAVVVFFFRLVPIYDVITAITKLFKTKVMSEICHEPTSGFLDPKICLNEMEKLHKYLVSCCPEEVCSNYHGKDVCLRIDEPMNWAGNGVAYELMMMMIAFVFFVIVVCLLDSGLMRSLIRLFDRLMPSSVAPLQLSTDPDVEAEKARIDDMMSKGNVASDGLVAHHMSKRFGKTLAVKDVTFGVYRNECFGLLGVNGAGKTTTFRMLTGDTIPTSGNAYRSSFNVCDSLESYRRELGYCPQFDPLLDKLTGEETLFLFGRLRGVSERQLQNTVSHLITVSDLCVHAKARTETYSGGNKRKLSLAMALIGAPRVIMLDEPTAGVDPTARRKIWNTLTHILQRDTASSIILTSHSMQECEALCSRISIMTTGGQFRCLGSTQHLRSRFGQGYTVSMKFAQRPDNVSSLLSHMQAAFPSIIVTDMHESVLTFRIPDPTVHWSRLFDHMEKTSRDFHAEDYTVSDTTLEQIFVSFAREHQTHGLNARTQNHPSLSPSLTLVRRQSDGSRRPVQPIGTKSPSHLPTNSSLSEWSASTGAAV